MRLNVFDGNDYQKNFNTSVKKDIYTVNILFLRNSSVFLSNVRNFKHWQSAENNVFEMETLSVCKCRPVKSNT